MKPRKTFCLLLVSILVLAAMLVSAPIIAAEEADSVYRNSTVYTVDEDFSTASAFAVKDGKFIYVGDCEGVEDYIGEETMVYDLDEESSILPGLHDAHLHIRWDREIYPEVRDIRKEIGEWASVERMQEVIKDAIETGDGLRRGADHDWVVLDGWMSDVWDPPEFHRELLDEVAPDTPVFIWRYTHGSGANTKALELAGIDEDTPDPPGGHITKDEDGVPTGEFVERAPEEILELIPPAPERTKYQDSHGFIEGLNLAVESGLTTVHGMSRTGLSTVEERAKMAELGLLRLRINEAVNYDTAKSLGEPMNVDNFYFVQSVKDLADGALGARGAWLKEEYSDQEGYYGEPELVAYDFDKSLRDDLTAEELEDIWTKMAINLWDKHGFNMRVHAIGDMANHVMLNAFERAMNYTEASADEVRFAIEHSQVLLPEDIERFGELGVIASVNQIHAIEDMHFAGSRLGEREKYGWAWQSLLDGGATIVGGTDYSVSPYNPFYNLHAAITRQDRDLEPEGGWYPDEAMSREDALRSVTINAAYAMFMEDKLGSIEEGKLADFVVIPVDYMEVPDDDIFKIEPNMTVIDGEVVFEEW